MKKIFTFIAAMATCVSMLATTYTPAPGENVISPLVSGLADGDSIVLSTGTYTEWNSMTFSTKVTIIAAPDAQPVLHWYAIKMSNDFEINGIEMHNVSGDNNLLRTGANVTGTIAIKNCSFSLNAVVTTATPFIYLSSNSVGNLIIDNCVFNANSKDQGAIIYGTSATIGNFSMTNCTANGAGAGYDLAVWVGTCTTAYVDHCTFYNCGTRAIYIATNNSLTSCLVQNCILSNPAAGSNYCIATYAGDVKNCMYYNLNAPRSSNATVTSCVNADPLFVNAANGDFTLSASSPALAAGTDGKAIGDPRWAPQGPSTLAEALAGKTIRRALNDQEYVYVLAVDADKKPTLVKADFEGNIVTNYATDFCSKVGTVGLEMVLSDIALTEDGVLVGCNLENCKFSEPTATNPFNVYGWNEDGTGSVVFTYTKPFWASACWNNGLTGVTMAYKGTLTKGQMLVAGRHGNDLASQRHKQVLIAINDSAVLHATVNEGQSYTGMALPDLQNVNHPDSAKFITLASNKVPQLFEYIDTGVAAAKTETLKGALAASYSGAKGVSVAKKDAADWMIIPAEDGVEILNITAGLASAAQVHNLAAASTVEADFIYAGLTSNGEKVVLMRDASLELINVPASGTNLEDMMMPAEKVVKVIRGGQLIIIRNGEAFNAIGARL